MHRYQNKFTKVSAAVSLYGFSFGAQSGSTQYVDLYYAMGAALHNHYVYGNNAKPESSGRVFESNS